MVHASRMMKPLIILALTLFVSCSTEAADLPTVTIEHLYYLRARGERIGKLKPDEMIEYCLAQKIGGTPFENLYAQMFAMRMDFVRMIEIEEVTQTDFRIVTIRKTLETYGRLLREEAQRVQNGIAREGYVASDTLQAIARAQTDR
jgi:hypothetical protein